MGPNKTLKKFKKDGWKYSKGADGIDPFVICPSGSVYYVRYIREGCPICDQYAEDNPDHLDEVFCSHDETLENEISDARIFLTLVREKERNDLVNEFYP